MTRFAIGIDGGGTSCRAAVADEKGTILGRGKAGAANIMSNPEEAQANIVAAAKAAFDDAGIDPTETTTSAAVLGVAGANVGPYGTRIQATLPFARTRVVTDSLIALQGALGPSDGVVGAFGTGSVYSARRDGEVTEIGGWEFIVGDQASGARLGRNLLEVSLLGHDTVRPATPITRIVMNQFSNDPQRIVEFAHDAKPKDFAFYAPLIFEHAALGDTAAVAIVKQAASDIDETLHALLWPQCRAVCLLGGLSDAYRAWLSPKHQALLVEPKGDALSGAVAFAAELAAEVERRSA